MVHLELAEHGVAQALEELARERERGVLARGCVGYAASIQRLMTSATLWPPKPIEFDSEWST